jgi:hypothetical protein
MAAPLLRHALCGSLPAVVTWTVAQNMPSAGTRQKESGKGSTSREEREERKEAPAALPVHCGVASCGGVVGALQASRGWQECTEVSPNASMVVMERGWGTDSVVTANGNHPPQPLPLRSARLRCMSGPALPDALPLHSPLPLSSFPILPKHRLMPHPPPPHTHNPPPSSPCAPAPTASSAGGS